MFIAVLLGGFKYTHPHPPPSDGRKMSLFAERAPERTSTNRVSAVFSRGDSPEYRPSRGENRTRKATDVYDEIVSVLAAAGLKTAVTKWRIERGLIEGLGATQQQTLNRHLQIMVRLGYIKSCQGGSAYLSPEYDLVWAKVREIALRAKALEHAEKGKGARPRR